jgi:hypothetical protein
MKKSDIQPNSIYRTKVTTRGGGKWFRTGEALAFVSAKPATDDGQRATHLLLWADRSRILKTDAAGERSWDWQYVDADGNPTPDHDRWVKYVQQVRWVDNNVIAVHGDELHDLTFQNVTQQLEREDISRRHRVDMEDLPVGFLTDGQQTRLDEYNAAYEVWEAAADAEAARTGGWTSDEWDEATPQPWSPENAIREELEEAWGTPYFWNRNRSYSPSEPDRDLPERVAFASIVGPYTDHERAAVVLAERAEHAEREVVMAERAVARLAKEAVANEFVASVLANVPAALVEQCDNGLPSEVERAQQYGITDWHANYTSDYSEVDAETPDARSLVGLKATALAAITHAWREVYGDAPWEDIVAGVYARHAEDEIVNHLYVDVLKTEDGEAKAKRVAQYLPDNYSVTKVSDFGSRGGEIVIAGVDRQGWTAVDYVIPRLATGLLIVKAHRKTRRPMEVSA